MQHTTRTGEPRLATLASWAVLAASFGLSASTWIALATLAGFKGSAHLTWPFDVTLYQSWLLPIAVDGYVVAALVLWLSPVPARVARFARTNTYVAALIGVGTQSAYHALSVWAETGLLWRTALSLVVGALPPGFAALAVHMRALRWHQVAEAATPTAVDAVPVPAPVVELPAVPPVAASVAVAPVPEPLPVPAPRQAPHPVRSPGRRSAAERLADRVQVLGRPAA